MSNANFDDLLSGQGFCGTKEKKGPRTIAEMRKEEMAKEMDPEKLKVEKCTIDQWLGNYFCRFCRRYCSQVFLNILGREINYKRYRRNITASGD